MASTQPASHGPPRRRLKPMESFTILFMVALGWTCSSSHGSSGGSGDKDDDDSNFFVDGKAATIVEEPARADEQ